MELCMLSTVGTVNSKCTTPKLEWMPFKSHQSVRLTLINVLVVREERGRAIATGYLQKVQYMFD